MEMTAESLSKPFFSKSYPNNANSNSKSNSNKKKEYYDPEDEGYEPPASVPLPPSASGNSKSHKDLKFDSLLSPHPVGGRGTNQQEENGFFFRKQQSQPPQPQPQSQEQEQVVLPPPGTKKLSLGNNKKQQTLLTATQSQSQTSIKSQQQQQQVVLIPFLKDEKGNPLFLTCEQAERNFQIMMDNDKNNNSKNDDDNENDVDEDLTIYSKSQEQSSSSSSLSTTATATATATTWEDAGITSPVLLQNLRNMECFTPLPVQDKACPTILTGSSDVLVGTYTGSGKTLAFLVPLIERVLISNANHDDDDDDDDDGHKKDATDATGSNHGNADTNSNGGLRILIVVPGRELASQVVSVARQLLIGTGLSALLAIGGTGFGRNLQDIRQKKPTIIVGTPGRIAELVVGKPGEK